MRNHLWAVNFVKLLHERTKPGPTQKGRLTPQIMRGIWGAVRGGDPEAYMWARVWGCTCQVTRPETGRPKSELNNKNKPTSPYSVGQSGSKWGSGGFVGATITFT